MEKDRRLYFRAAMTLLTMLLTTATWAESAIGSIQYNSTGGYYEIGSTDNLNDLAVYVNGTGTYSTGGNETEAHDCSGMSFKLGADIAYSHTTDWNNAESTENNYTAIGGYFNNSNCPFSGTFDGQGHTIRGIRIYKNGDSNDDGCQGLFGMTGDGAVIRGITLADARITGYDRTGGIVGKNTGTVTDCHVAANVAIHAVSASAYYHGGIVGDNYLGTVSNCTSAATLTTNSNSVRYYGGIAGINNGGTLSNNLAIGAVVPVTDNNTYGAICGENYAGSNNTAILRNNYYHACKVASNDVTASGVGCGHISDNTPNVPSYLVADVTDNNGAVPGIILYDHSAKTDVNSYIFNKVGNAEVPRVELADRTLYKDGNWNTLCLPFGLASLIGTPLEGATVMELLKTSYLDSDGKLTLNFAAVTSIEAGNPYIVKWDKAADIVNPVFTDVTISSANPTAVDFSGGSFVGNYAPLEITDANRNSIVLLAAGNKLGYAKTDRTIANGKALGAFRAYFNIPENNGSLSAREFELNFDDDEIITGIIDIDIEHRTLNIKQSDGAIYNMAGQKLNKPQKGINIIKGHKVAF